MSDSVVLLHGIFRHSRSMVKMENYLSSAGMRVLNVDYPSTRYALEDLADMIHKEISAFNMPEMNLHFVGYSMGGLLTRAYLNRYKTKNLGKVVMIGTPNRGSKAAKLFSKFGFYRKLFGPAGQQLSSDQRNVKHILGEVNYDVGIIAGNKSIWPKTITTANDGLVSVNSTKLENAKDHIVLPFTHWFFPDELIVQEQVLHFIKNGRFLNMSAQMKWGN